MKSVLLFCVLLLFLHLFFFFFLVLFWRDGGTLPRSNFSSGMALARRQTHKTRSIEINPL